MVKVDPGGEVPGVPLNTLPALLLHPVHRLGDQLPVVIIEPESYLCWFFQRISENGII